MLLLVLVQLVQDLEKVKSQVKLLNLAFRPFDHSHAVSPHAIKYGKLNFYASDSAPIKQWKQ